MGFGVQESRLRADLVFCLFALKNFLILETIRLPLLLEQLNLSKDSV